MLIYLITRNTGKVSAAQKVFAGTDIEIHGVEKDYPEIQADTSAEIAEYTARAAAEELQAPTIREDHSIFFNALGAPGPYASYFEKKVAAATLLTMMSGFPDRSGYFEVSACYAEPGGKTKLFTFRVPFSLTKEERGDLQKGWNRLIILEGETRTLAEYPETERLSIWGKNFSDIVAFLNIKS